MPHYRLHMTHSDGITTTADLDSASDLAVGDVVDHDGGRWVVQEIEPFELEDYEGFVAVVPAGSDDD